VRFVAFTVALLIVGLVGLGAVPLAMERDAQGRDWQVGQVGGSMLFAYSVAFARVLPFAAGLGAGIGLLQRLRRKRRPALLNAQVQRHDSSAVIVHWLVAIGMILGTVSAALLLRWVPRFLPLESIYVLHFAASALVVLAVAHHLTYEGVGGGRALLVRSWSEVKSALAETFGYLGVFGREGAAFGLQLPSGLRRALVSLLKRRSIEVAPEGKFAATERVISYPGWAVLVGLLTLTGFVKALRYLYPVDGVVLQFTTWLHDALAIWVVVWLLIHIVPVLIIPANWPMLRSIFTGRVSRRYAQQRHPLWLAELLEQSRDAASNR